MSETSSGPSYRATFLTILLLLLVGTGSTLFFLLVLGPFFVGAVVVIAGLVGIGWVNYLLWGRSFSRRMTEGPAVPEEPTQAAELTPPEANGGARRSSNPGRRFRDW
ncbi:MAG: hypothetical protein NZ700_04685 [Gemmataceae bacterium]|nr:hypothetical protein [Gemmataceae bacterium]MDW8264914.1 hypothetical protein [Gemmataceae bacterium]